MSSLEASQILASALKDVDEILKVSEHELNEFHGAGTTSKNQDKSPDISSQGIRGISESESGNHKAVSFDATDIYRTGKEFSVLNNRLQNFIDKLSHSRRMSRVHTSEYQALDFGLTENNSSDVIQLPATRPTKLDLNVIEQPQQIQSPYILSSNEHNPYFSDKGLHRRIIKLQEQIQAQANRIAELEKDGNPLSYLVSKTNTTEYRNHEADQPSMDIDNIQLLNEVSKQHLRISLLEETNRDLEEKINKLEKELSQRSNSLQLTNSYEELQSSKYNRQYATIHSTVSSRSATLSNNMNTLDESSRQSNRLNYPTPLRRSLTPVTFNNNSSFINISNQSEHNLTVIHQSMTAGSGTQSTPPTSRLFNDEKQYTAYNAHLLNEQPINYNNKFLLPNENYTYLYNTDQFKSASLNELRYSKIIQSNVTTTHMNTMTSCSTNNIIFNTNTSKHYLAQNRYSMKSPPTFMLNGNNIQDSNRINLLPPQYGRSYHQETYHNAHSRSLALPPALPPVTPSSLSSSSQWCRQLTKNNYIDGRQTSADCALNERVQLFNSPDKCNSPIIRRCTTSVQQHTNLPRSRNKFMLLNASSSSASEKYDIIQSLNNSINNSKDETGSSLSKFTPNGKNQFKRLNIERACGEGWRSITTLFSPSLIDVFHWLSHGQVNKSISNALSKSYSVHHHQCEPQTSSTDSSLYIRSKSMERYYCGDMKSSTMRSRRKAQETILPSLTNNNNHDHDNVSSNPVSNSSSSTTVYFNSTMNDKSSQIYQEYKLESTDNGPLTSNMTVLDSSILYNNDNNNNNIVRQVSSSFDDYKNKLSVSPAANHESNKITSSYLDNVNKFSSSHTGLKSSSSEQRQTFQFAYTKRNFLSWDKNMISAWLYKIGLGYTVSHTRRWLTSGQDLVNESKKSLAQLMDIRNPLHLKKLLIHIRLCMKDHCPNNNNHYNYGYLCRNIEPPENFDIPGWLVDLGLSSYIPQFDNCIIDPYVLDQLTMDDLSVLKMSNELHVLSLRWGIQMLRHINFDRTRLCRSHMEQCEANISRKGSTINSPIQSQNHTQDNMKPIDRYNRNHMDNSTLNSINSLKSESMNSEIKSIYSTYLPIQICYWTQQRVMNWLESIELPEYASKLCGSGVHGALMILEDRFTPDLLADILQISPVKSLVRRHLTNKFIELVGLDIWERKQHHEVNNNNNNNNSNNNNHSKHYPLTIHSKIKFTKKKSIFHSNREHKFSYHDLVTGGTGDEDANTELVCPIEINPDHMSIFAEEIVKPNCQIIHPQTEIIPTILIDPVATSVQHLELQETDL
ncbi:unnamed protein product [Schistosoma turkestanicum]|nr:unnamed protein product [Schistosoma turkestanicum]